MKWFTRFLTAALLLLLAPMAEAANLFTIYVTQDDPAVLEKALVNAANVESYFRAKGESTRIEIVAAGQGVNLLRPDRSSLAPQISVAAHNVQDLHISASGETLQMMAAKEGKEPALFPEVSIVPSAATRLIELRDEGYGSLSYSLLMKIYFARLLGTDKATTEAGTRAVATATEAKALAATETAAAKPLP